MTNPRPRLADITPKRPLVSRPASRRRGGIRFLATLLGMTALHAGCGNVDDLDNGSDALHPRRLPPKIEHRTLEYARTYAKRYIRLDCRLRCAAFTVTNTVNAEPHCTRVEEDCTDDVNKVTLHGDEASALADGQPWAGYDEGRCYSA